MFEFEEIRRYVEQIIRRKTVNYSPDIRDDILGEAMLKLWTIWPKMKLPVRKAYLQKTFAQLPYRIARKYIGDGVHLPMYFANNGIYAPEHLDRLDELLAKVHFNVSPRTRKAITHVLQPRTDPAAELKDPSPYPDKEAERLEILKKLFAWLDEEEYGMIVRLASGVSQAELAREKGCTRQNISNHVKKILNRIEKEINK